MCGDRIFSIVEFQLYLCRHRSFRLDIGGVGVFTTVPETNWRSNFAPADTTTVWQASGMDLEHPVRFGGISNTC